MKYWKEVLIKSSTTIIEAIKIITDSSLQIALVVDNNQRLIGTLTDGDIRRGILKGVDLINSVDQIMNTTPLVANQNDSRNDILSLMRRKSIKQIPLIDEHGVVSGIEILDDLINPQTRDNLVILMAGGLGSRLQPLTNNCPKPLLEVGSKPILETIIENFIDYGFKRFYLSVNYKAEMLREYFGDGSKWGVEIDYISEEMAMGTAGPLGLLPEKPEQPFIVMNGDLLTKVNFQQLLDFHNEHHAKATVCVREYDFQIPYGVVTMDKFKLTGIEEKPVHRFFVNAGIYVLTPEVIELIPSQTRFDMTELLDNCLNNSHEAVVFPIREYWMDIGRIDDLERAKKEYSETFN